MKKKNISNKKTVIIAAAVVVILIVAAFMGIGAYASGLETSMPGISINGIDVGGCSQEEIASKLSDLTAEDCGYKNLTVTFPGDNSFEITPADAGLSNISEPISDAVYNLGKDGNIFSNAISYIKYAVFGSEVKVEDLVEIDETSVKNIITINAHETMQRVNEGYVIEDDTLYVTKGAKAITIVPDNVYPYVEKAYQEMNFEPVVYEADKAEAKEIDIEDIYNSICTEVINATYDKATGEITDSSIGMDFDLDDAKEKFANANDGEKIAIPLTIEYPKTDAETLRTRLFADTLGSKSTSLSGSSSNRINNITLAAKAINGTVLNPGEEFSFNGVVGQRTTAKGYKEAGAYVGGETVMQVGGGICQVSSTIYYCTLLANLEITARDCHMFPVSYLPYGLDATVNWGTVDFKFVNDHNYPIKIVSYVSGSTLYVQILGTDESDGHYYTLTYKTIGTTPRPIEEKEDPTLAPGETKVERSGHDGITVQSYRSEYDADGNFIKSEYIATSTYKTQSKIILVGPQVTEPDNPDNPDSPVDPAPDPNPGTGDNNGEEMIDPDEIGG